jgi:DNA-binding transcriptional ArsR family regulator
MSSLTELFPNPALVKVLSLFLMHPEEEYYQRDIAERTRSGLLQVQRALRRIERAGLVTKTREGNRVYYTAEREHPAFQDLQRVFFKTVALGDVLRQALMPQTGRIRLAFIYGSLARGEEKAGSDIDLFLVGDITLREVTSVLGKIGRDAGREFNPFVYPTKEFIRKVNTRDHFITAVLESPKLWLIGNDSELARLAK